MCDTLVALGNATADGSVIFAKNSDREPNEAHELLLIPAATHSKGSTIRCTYLEIPQVQETNAVLLAKPFWIWGAEMGANSHGVVIGNEAVFTKVPYDKGPGLIGMDFIRLALERAATARSAMEVIVNLLETYGQGGSCGFTHPFFYHNSFIIADPVEAWVLETAGRQWAAVQVKDVASISNAITIGGEWDLASDGLVDYAVQRGWCKRRDDFDFKRCYSDFLYTRFSAALSRRSCTASSLIDNQGQITVEMMINYLRKHASAQGQDWSPGSAIYGSDVCMHVGFGPIRINQSVGSMVSHLTPQVQTHWLTGTSAPCTGIFKPVWINAGLSEQAGLHPKGEYDAASLWWRHEALHRQVLCDYAARISLYCSDRDALEHEFVCSAQAIETQGVAERLAFSERCFAEAGQAIEEWTDRVRRAPIRRGMPMLYRLAWQGFNRQAKMNG